MLQLQHIRTLQADCFQCHTPLYLACYAIAFKRKARLARSCLCTRDMASALSLTLVPLRAPPVPMSSARDSKHRTPNVQELVDTPLSVSKLRFAHSPCLPCSMQTATIALPSVLEFSHRAFAGATSPQMSPILVAHAERCARPHSCCIPRLHASLLHTLMHRICAALRVCLLPLPPQANTNAFESMALCC